MSVEEIETEIARLWDEQIERDLEAGRLDSLLDDVAKEVQAGMARPL